MFLKFINLFITKLLVFIACTCIFQSCEQEVQLKIPSEESCKVLNCILYPDSFIKVYTSNSQPITDTSNFRMRTRDTVIAFENGLPIDTLTYTNNSYYISTYKPLEGRAYTIKAKDGMQYSGTDSIPTISKIDTFNLVKINGNNYYFRLVYRNPKQTNNYFLLRALKKDSLNRIKSNVYTVLTTVAGTEMLENGILLNNQQFKDSTISLDFSVYSAQPGKLIVEIQHISYSLYWYYITLIQNYYANIGESYQRINMFNNIENGVGIVGASAILRDSIELCARPKSCFE